MKRAIIVLDFPNSVEDKHVENVAAEIAGSFLTPFDGRNEGVIAECFIGNNFQVVKSMTALR